MKLIPYLFYYYEKDRHKYADWDNEGPIYYLFAFDANMINDKKFLTIYFTLVLGKKEIYLSLEWKKENKK